MDFLLNSFVSDPELSEGVVAVISYVVFCASLTTLIWHWLYEARSDYAEEHLQFLRDSSTTQFLDSVFNAAIFACFVGVITFAMVGLMLYQWKRTVVLMVQLAYLSLLITLPLTIVGDLLDAVGIGDNLLLLLLAGFVFLYFSVGYLAFFTNRLPARLVRIFAALNCALISVILLRCLPHQTIWPILLVDIVWDFFSVRAGPVRKMLESSHEYGGDIVKFVMLTTADDKDDTELEDDEQLDTRNAYQVLNSGGAQLGMGDFVFFAILVGRTWADHPSCAIASMIGIAVGLVVNFAVSSDLNADRYVFVPALPCPLLLGMGLHFGTLYATRMLQQMTAGLETIIL
uniref:Presenilin n=1 Tax=Globodera rostochiensis TaxID=31243 RepID=A0A914HHK2_GLORO